jgi:uncharacterized membrane protein YvbJ
MKCTNCGRELPDENRAFCGYCGHRLNQVPNESDLIKDLPAQDKPKKFLHKKWVWFILIGLILLFLCVLVVVVYLYFFVPGLYITL